MGMTTTKRERTSWTEAEMQYLLENQGKSFDELAQALGRSKRAVQSRLQVLSIPRPHTNGAVPLPSVPEDVRQAAMGLNDILPGNCLDRVDYIRLTAILMWVEELVTGGFGDEG